ncbi:hypothetical protein [Streptomyces sp. BK340]|uniref:hypothetical protein n=1 Tax=Streptomyces sp. BK340 TaxID=2572903 RepID=UPI0011A6C170|nr:hypothetical protein [Streptomyces sp. BK340]
MSLLQYPVTLAVHHLEPVIGVEAAARQTLEARARPKVSAQPVHCPLTDDYGWDVPGEVASIWRDMNG